MSYVLPSIPLTQLRSQAVLPPTAGLVAWFAADDIDGAGNQTVSNGSYVAAWKNKGSAPDAVAPSNYYQPAAKLANGEAPSVLFTGVQARAPLVNSKADFAFLHTTGVYDIFFVCRRKNNVGESPPFSSTGTTADKGIYFVFTQTGVWLTITKGTPGVPLIEHVVAKPAPVGVVKKFHLRGDGANSRISDDFSTYAVKAFTSTFGTGDATNDFQLGSYLQLASLGEGGDRFFDGDLHQLLIYNRNLGPSELAQVQAYLLDRAGV